MKIHHRRSIRLNGYDNTQDGNYFLIICTRNRECLFEEVHEGRMYLSNYGKMVNECWQEIPAHFPQIVLHEYVIMPNHMHGIIEINTPQSTGTNMDVCTNTMDVYMDNVGVYTDTVNVVSSLWYIAND